MADVKQQWASTTSGSGGLTSLASSPNTTQAGHEWFVVDCTINRPTDVRHDGKIRRGTSPTANTEILIYLIASNDGTTWPDVFDGTPSAETPTSVGILGGYAKLAAALRVDTTTSDLDQPYEFNALSVFNGSLPKKYAVFVTQNTGVALNATPAEHTYRYTETYYTNG